MFYVNAFKIDPEIKIYKRNDIYEEMSESALVTKNTIFSCNKIW